MRPHRALQLALGGTRPPPSPGQAPRGVGGGLDPGKGLGPLGAAAARGLAGAAASSRRRASAGWRSGSTGHFQGEKTGQRGRWKPTYSPQTPLRKSRVLLPALQQLTAPSPPWSVPQPSTSSVTSDEKVDYVQVDKEKTQALQNTMQEWTDVRQSSEPSKGAKL